MSVVTVNKNLENRYQALKWMHNQSATGFLTRDVIDKFHVPSTFLSATGKKSLTKSSGRDGSKYIGEEPTIKTAVEVYDFERQMLGRKKPFYDKKVVDTESLDKFKGVVQKALQSQTPPKEENLLQKKQLSFSVNIQGNMVVMHLDDFYRLMNK